MSVDLNEKPLVDLSDLQKVILILNLRDENERLRKENVLKQGGIKFMEREMREEQSYRRREKKKDLQKQKELQSEIDLLRNCIDALASYIDTTMEFVRIENSFRRYVVNPIEIELGPYGRILGIDYAKTIDNCETETFDEVYFHLEKGK